MLYAICIVNDNILVMYNNSVSLHQALRQKHPEFCYQSANWQIIDGELHLFWLFQTSPNLEFKPQMAMPLPVDFALDEAKKAVIDNLVFQIGLVEMLSYWKATTSPQIIIRAGSLTPDQINWWHKLLIKGLGEYFFTNQIDFTPTDFVTIQTTQKQEDSQTQTGKFNIQADLVTVATNHPDQTKLNRTKLEPTPLNPKVVSHSPTTATQPGKTQSKPTVSKYLIPLGGGKDSIVTLELLRQYQKTKPLSSQLLGLAINPTPATRQISQLADLPLIEVRRRLDPKLFDLNNQNYLNGHTPFSALVAMTSMLVAYLYDCPQIVLSNEKSSNEGNTQYLGQSVNHQYSKTFEFESDFRDYVETYIQPLLPKDQLAPQYFSLLRPFFELKIGQLFARLGKDYFSVFRSCNRGQKTGVWCGECAKCLFAFSILFPFLGEDMTTKIFGQNLFQNPRLDSVALELMGQKATKPFECVGTHQESKVAFDLSSQWYLQKNQPLPHVLLQLQDLLAQYPDLPGQAKQILDNWDEHHFIPQDLVSFLFSQKKIVRDLLDK